LVGGDRNSILLVLFLVQVNDMHEAALEDFGTRLAAAATAPPSSHGSKVELRSAVHDAKCAPLAAPVNALSACPHHVSRKHHVPSAGTCRYLMMS
jgi:hypothetical protein